MAPIILFYSKVTVRVKLNMGVKDGEKRRDVSLPSVIYIILVLLHKAPSTIIYSCRGKKLYWRD